MVRVGFGGREGALASALMYGCFTPNLTSKGAGKLVTGNAR